MFSQVNKNEEKIRLLIDIYKEINQYNHNYIYQVANTDLNKDEILECLFHELANIFINDINEVLAQIAKCIKVLGGEPSILLTYSRSISK